jgi:MFS family permease
VRVALIGFVVIVASALGAAGAPEHAGAWLAVPLFTLGVGWSLSFVAGSALLTRGLSYADRTRLQGATDSVVWIAAAAAGFGSGVFIGAFSYALLCMVGAALVAIPVVMITGRRRVLAPAV